MPGAVIVADQSTGAGAGVPGEARNDLWLLQPIALSVGTSGNTTYEWTLVDKPPGSAATLSTPTASTSGFTPDVVGTYRIRLVTNGGGAGNIQILVFRVRYSNSGAALASRGWALPALGEVAAEANYGGNTRAWAEALEAIFADIRYGVDAAEYRALNQEIVLLAAEKDTSANVWTRVASKKIKLAAFPASLFGKTRVVKLQVEIESNVTAVVTQVRLYDRTSGVAVATSAIDNSALGDRTVPTFFDATITVGAASGNLRNDVEHEYYLQIQRSGGTATDRVIISSARLVITYE